MPVFYHELRQILRVVELKSLTHTELVGNSIKTNPRKESNWPNLLSWRLSTSPFLHPHVLSSVLVPKESLDLGTVHRHCSGQYQKDSLDFCHQLCSSLSVSLASRTDGPVDA